MRPTAWLCKRENKHGWVWSLRWTDPATGKVFRKALGRDLALARRVLVDKRAEIGGARAAVGAARRAPDDPEWAAFVAEYLDLAAARVKPSTLKRHALALRVFGDICTPSRLSSVDYRMVERFAAERLKTTRPATVNSELSSIRAALNAAVKRDALGENPVRRFPMLKVPEKELRVLSPAEARALLDVCLSTRWRAFVYLALSTGLRRSELLNLTWECVDLDAGVLKVSNRDDWTTKSGKNRVAYLDATAASLLRKMRDETRKRIAEEDAEHQLSWLFVTRTGARWENNVTRGFNALVKRAGIRRCTLHDLRRTFCSALANAGVSAAVVKDLAGHADIDTTLRFYTKVSPDAKRAAVLSLPFAPASNAAAAANLGASRPA
ncbi:MAG: site-specific integrase [Planctomycetes bacterium]|nr:site-specific integrase [Planctomycetota bacterium]